MTATATLRPIDRVLDRLNYQGQRSGHDFKCHCPTHDDSKESLSVTEGKNGIVLLKCFAGCETKKIVEAIGLTFADLNPVKVKNRANRREVATYDYVNEVGDLLYQVVRFEPKDFRQRRPDGRGGWIWSLKGRQRVLYALPRLLQSPVDQWSFVVEGEKDADALNRLDLIATTNAQGVGKWESYFNQWLVDRRVCLIPDNDEPGRKHMQSIAAQLQPFAKQVRILELPRLKTKGDVSDWLAQGGTVDQLLALTEAATDYIAPIPAPASVHLNGNGATHVGDIDSMLVEHPTHDSGNAEVVEALHPNRFAYCVELGWMHNTSSHWATEGAEFEVNRTITKTLKRRRTAAVEAEREDVVKHCVPNESRKNAVKGMFKDIVAVLLKDFDNDPDVLNCSNGVIDLRTGQLIAHGPSNRFTYCVQTPYNPDADRSAWLDFLSKSLADYEETADWFQMANGYSFTGQTREECMFYVEGPSRSGKGTYTNTNLTLLGSPLARGVDFSTFTRARDGDSQNFDLAPLRPARFIAASESGRYSSLNEATIKNITGNDPIIASYKHRDEFTYIPRFKIWLSSNHPAKGDVDDEAFWGRLRVIRFPNSHLGNEDKSLKWRMCGPDVLPGVLAWAVEGARRWYASPQGLITPFAVHKATQQRRAEMDHVQQWLEECTVPGREEAVTVPNLYKSYETWCEDNGHTPKKAVAFGRALVAKGFEPARKKIGDTTHRAYRGLILRSSMD